MSRARRANGSARRLRACPVLRGDHKGTVGYYDDDEGGRAVVYLGEPFVSDPVLLSRGTLQKIDAKSTELEKWKRRYPWLAKQLGVP